MVQCTMHAPALSTLLFPGTQFWEVCPCLELNWVAEEDGMFSLASIAGNPVYCHCWLFVCSQIKLKSYMLKSVSGTLYLMLVRLVVSL